MGQLCCFFGVCVSFFGVSVSFFGVCVFFFRVSLSALLVGGRWDLGKGQGHWEVMVVLVECTGVKLMIQLMSGGATAIRTHLCGPKEPLGWEE